MFLFPITFWKKIVLSILIFQPILAVTAQVVLTNASFEGIPSDATMPSGWFECSQYTTPDILPGFWGVYDDAQSGDTFMGLITRSDGSFESIGQRFSKALESDHCYHFSFFANQSNFYAGFNNNVKLRIWLGESKCSRNQLIFESEISSEDDWQEFFVDFVPDHRMHYIIIETSHVSGNHNKGNVLLDNISKINACIRP